MLQRDGFRCRYCGATPLRGYLQLDHVDPRGPSRMENLVTSCAACNNGKSDQLDVAVPA